MRQPLLFALSSRTKIAGTSLPQNLKAYLEESHGAKRAEFLDDLAHTLFSRRSTLNWRMVIAAATSDELIDALGKHDLSPCRALDTPRLGFVFTGQGAQWHAMGRELVNGNPTFQRTLLAANNHLRVLGASWSLHGWFSQFNRLS